MYWRLRQIRSLLLNIGEAYFLNPLQLILAGCFLYLYRTEYLRIHLLPVCFHIMSSYLRADVHEKQTSAGVSQYKKSIPKILHEQCQIYMGK